MTDGFETDIDIDFVMTIPLGFMAEKYGQRKILWLNLVPRVFMLSWAFIVGYFEQSLPAKAVIAGPFLSVLGGDCVFNSMTYALAAGITDDYVLRYVTRPVTYAYLLIAFCQCRLFRMDELGLLCCCPAWSSPCLGHYDCLTLATILDWRHSVDHSSTNNIVAT